ncbi:rRNA (guanine-N1)-methyltransferase [Parashewanella curva]|uniref:rRNA (Guanine-N1)-methyltransferase n=1 Tax=Parashewanella curva TaxID=2338552 RepID=A0A3L8Q1G5_9GAMM|nr:PilC/PilY family type IV pilus protein [Parashewanella curva]RLV61424.1 rRNA (guanine-N1)-methyltransferase [Parashewanella curva]
MISKENVIKKFVAAVSVVASCAASFSFADDTELYIAESSARSGVRPKVLIIFDTSGSMRTSLNAKKFYPRTDSLDNSTKLFFSKTDTVPTQTSLSFISNGINACETSKEYLQHYGMYTGYLREYRFTSDNGSWEELPYGSGDSIQVIDCYGDIENKYSGNGALPNGFPVDGEGTRDSPKRYELLSDTPTEAEIANAISKAKLTEFGIGKPVTLYTENYINWYHTNSDTQDYSRMDIAKRVIEDTVVTTPAVDFGLMAFNYAVGDENGGRIVKKIEKNNDSGRDILLSLIPDLNARGGTPLCETMYEAYRYFSGKDVVFGNQNLRGLSPGKDSTAEREGKYISPFDDNVCGASSAIIYITDGEPTYDNDSDADVVALTGATPADRVQESYLPSLAGWLSSNDVNPTLQGTQTVRTFTIGFSAGATDAAPVLNAAAQSGKGQYFSALDSVQLQNALRQTVNEILTNSSSFTSPSIASNNFDRTQTHDSVYYAMFSPKKGARWLGNLKKFKVSGNGVIKDSKGNNVIGADGNIDSGACSYWTNCNGGSDGNEVSSGGVLGMLQGVSERTIYSNLEAGLKALTKTNAEARAGGGDQLATHIGVDPTQVSNILEWAKGKDIDDEDGDGNSSENRVDILGDPLHSKPLAIDFGSSTGSENIRILMGTNHGFLHMFKDSGANVEESWAFLPYELLPNLPELRANVPTGVHSVYGIDSPPVAYIERSTTGIQKAWVFVGMRRGGGAYYALDITSPDSPKFLWKIDSGTLGINELGQTWSEPVVTRVPGHGTHGEGKPVLIFGAGYAPITKDGTGVGQDDSKGRGVFIVDAETGSLVHYFGHGASGSKQTLLPGITDSIPNSVAVLDSDADGFTDRIYATDTGGNVWRMDLATWDSSKWTAFKFADLGGNTQTTDRRFFSAPTVAQTIITNVKQVTTDTGGTTTTRIIKQDIPYDAVVVGSGSRPSPLDKSRSDIFFTLQDRNINSKSFDGTDGNSVPDSLTISDLFDVTTASPANESQNLLFSAKKGWYYDFKASGEKSLSAATIINGKVFFTSFVPGNSSENQCLVGGVGRLYGFDLHRGARAYTSEFYEMSQRVPDTPQLVVPPNGDDPSYMYLIGIGSAGDKMVKVGDDKSKCADGDNRCLGSGPQANRVYYHVVE